MCIRDRMYSASFFEDEDDEGTLASKKKEKMSEDYRGFFAKQEEVSKKQADLDKELFRLNSQREMCIRDSSYRVAKYIGAYAAAMNGVDAIAFTAGIGENTSFRCV